MTFYLKYRPQKIEDLDMKNVRESLQKVIKSGNIPHAFLFSGPKGTGKTSAARILAKVINCESNSKKMRGKDGYEPCNKCETCKSITRGENIDVIEMDAASHRGIDDIRLLKDAVKLSPARANKKVYIIDEAHMLTTEASNALLKTLEEPPEHVVFILATTNPEKLIGTVRSRTTNVLFKKAKTDEIVQSLKKVVDGEKIKADKEALEMIANVADGSFRDAQKIMEQILTEAGDLSKTKTEELLLDKNIYDIDEFITLLLKKETQKLLEIIEEVASSSSISTFTSLLIDRLRGVLLSKYSDKGPDYKKLDEGKLIFMLDNFSQAYNKMQYSPIEQLPLEIEVIKWCGELSKSQKTSVTNEQKKSIDTKKGQRDEPKKSVRASNTLDKNGDVIVNTTVGLPKGMNEDVWTVILSKVRPLNASTEALLRAAKPIEYNENELKLGVYYKFHKEKLEANPHRDILEDILEGVLGKPTRVICTLTEPPSRPEPKDEENVVLTESKDEDIIKVAEEIFGS